MSFLLMHDVRAEQKQGHHAPNGVTLGRRGQHSEDLAVPRVVAALTKSDGPPVPDYGAWPGLPEPHWPSRSIFMAALMTIRLSFSTATSERLLKVTGTSQSPG